MTGSPRHSPFDLQKGASAVVCVAAGLLLLWLAFRYALGIALPFLLAWGLSGVVKPLVNRICRRGRIPRSLCAAGLVIVAVGLTVVLAVSGLRRGISELGRLANELAADTDGVIYAVEAMLSRLKSISSHIPFLRRFEDAPFYADFCAKLDGVVEAGIARLTEMITARIPSAAMSLAGFLPTAFIFITVVLLACYYLSADDGRIASGVSAAAARLTPEGVRDRLPSLGRRLGRLGKQYLRACLLLGGLTFLQAFIGLAVMGIPYAFILALLIAVVDFLPLLGTGIILVPWAVLCFLLGQVKLGVGLLILYGISTVVRQVLEPKLIGDGLGLHPLLSLLSMYAGLRLFGVGGMILAPLMAAAVKSVLGVAGIEES
ncbi:MAG: sporulation integral membrane protein YtvI [Clostridia bacterium]|nr:sporulation integral membrane protein YtvI [Clostridia bacterium]